MRVLLVEDSPADIELVKAAIEEVGFDDVDLMVAMDGVSALEMVGEEPPDLIILDLNIPKKSGHDVLREIKSHVRLRVIPVIVFTTSSSPTDIDKSYSNYANAFVRKPVQFDDLLAAIQSIKEFWADRVTLPRTY